MKILIGATCVVVLAAGVWSLEDHLIAHKQKAERAESERWVAKCFAAFDDVIALRNFNETTITNCVVFGGQPMEDELNRRLVAAGRKPFR